MKFKIQRFRMVGGANTLKATADVTLREAKTLPNGSVEDVFEIVTIHDIKLVEGKGGLFLSMPSIKRKDKYYMIATLHSESLLLAIHTEMLRLYEESAGNTLQAEAGDYEA